MSDAAGLDLARRGALRRFSRASLEGSSLEAARTLLGAVLVREEPGAPRLEVRIVETEAYDESDPASHTHRGETPGNRTMFGPAGHAYVYFTYGMHHCVNVVSGTASRGAAVLLRAAIVLAGVEVARSRRPAARSYRRLADGPAKLTQALGVDRSLDGLDLCAGREPLRLACDDVVVPDGAVRTGPRVGVRQAAERPWRFWVDGVPAVSTYRRHPRAG